MPALPWLRGPSAATAGAELVVMASRLPLRHYRRIPGFLRWTLRIRGQLAETPGLVGYSLDAKLLRKTFWTLSAWTSREAMEAFVREEPHRTAMASIRPHMGQSTFAFWTATPGDLPLKWAEARRRIADRPTAGRP
jgi:heme-degrading monooxygenase HmoA